MKQALLFSISLLWSAAVVAQQRDTLLNEVTVVDERYTWLKTAQYTFNQDSLALRASTNQSAAEWLMRESSSHVRQYAPGMVAGYSTHGATSAQNVVLWGGIPINSAATGLTDLSLVPVEIFSTSMLRGGSSAQFGSAAMGSVLNLQPTKQSKPLAIKMLFQLGSFHATRWNGEVVYRPGKLLLVTRFAASRSRNNYSYNNPYLPGQPEDSVKNAAYANYHIMQYLAYQLSQNQTIDLDLWYTDAARETPNNILVTTPAQAKLLDKTLRMRAGWHFLKNQHEVDINYAFLHEWQRYTDPLVPEPGNTTLDDTNKTSSHIIPADYLQQINQVFTWQSGVQYRYDVVGGSNRAGQQHTVSAQSGIELKTSYLEAQATLRAEVWRDTLLPLSPFASIKLPMFPGFALTAFGGYNYRVPSLNDRFWNPGGNAQLKPESGWSYEGAANYTYQNKKWNLALRAAFYNSTITDLVQWVPVGSGIWEPHNVKSVALSGTDYSVNIGFKHKRHIIQWSGSISYNDSRITASHIANDQSVGHQLIYQPEIKATQRLFYDFSGYFAQLDYVYVGEVYTNYSSQINQLDGYHLVDATIGWHTVEFGMDMTMMFAAKNILNMYYETIAFYPMPAINFALTMKVEL